MYHTILQRTCAFSHLVSLVESLLPQQPGETRALAAGAFTRNGGRKPATLHVLASACDGEWIFMCRRAFKLLLLLAVMGFPIFLQAQTAAQAPVTQAQIVDLQQAVRNNQAAAANAQMAGDNAWMLVSRRPGAADDRSRPGPVLRRPRPQKEHPGHHDAELRHDGSGHDPLGRGWLLAGLRSRQRLHRRL